MDSGRDANGTRTSAESPQVCSVGDMCEYVDIVKRTMSCISIIVLWLSGHKCVKINMVSPLLPPSLSLSLSLPSLPSPLPDFTVQLRQPVGRAQNGGVVYSEVTRQDSQESRLLFLTILHLLIVPAENGDHSLEKANTTVCWSR